jgi:hypothetical protein
LAESTGEKREHTDAADRHGADPARVGRASAHGAPYSKESNPMNKILLFALGVLAVSISSAGAGEAFSIAPIDSQPYGKSYGEWSGAWWQWCYSIPPDVNPVLTDPTGKYASLGQSGPVWFLAGTFNNETAVRKVVVPQGKALFFPIINYNWVNFPEYGDNPWSPEQEAMARGLAAQVIESAGELSCEIDGVVVADLMDYRCQTPTDGAYMVKLPRNNIWDVWLPLYGLDVDVPAGSYGPCIDDGYYLMLEPLAAGKHTIHFAVNGGLDVTYLLTVENTRPVVLPPASRAFGKTYGAWGGGWQQWCMNTTTENCPVTDTTGAFALVGQSRPAYFLAGTFGEWPDTPWDAPNPVVREVTIPTGVGLCVPTTNWGLIYPEDLPGVAPEDAVATMYEWLNAAFDNWPPENRLCMVDGVEVPNYRSQSQPLQVWVPAFNVQNDLMAYATGTHPCWPDDPPWYPYYAEGWHLSTSDGYYVMLAPLSAGQHTIRIRTGPESNPFCDVYYLLTVGKEK